MRLLKTGPYAPGKERVELVSFNKDFPDYAILSHRWLENEIQYPHVINGTLTEEIFKTSFGKLAGAMRQAQLDGYGWVWIDTCCIDKSSSAELQESINSMFPWYQNAKKCYTYMDDVTFLSWREEYGQSKWWSRGWTLQELLAPADLEFFASEWEPLGSKDQLKHAICNITGINEDFLDGTLALEHASVAKRMSWAATRNVTREEDLAYCLMGIFGVNMPMLYGEGGRRAFLRLQEEIMRDSDDQSLFLWIDPDRTGTEPDQFHGLLADTPKAFAHTGSMRPYTDFEERSPYVMTNRGLAIEMHLTPKDDGTFAAALGCPVPGESHSGFMAVYLKKLSTGHNQYTRVRCDKLASLSERGVLEEVYVRQTQSVAAGLTVFPRHFFQLRGHEQILVSHGYKMVDSRSLKLKPDEKRHLPLPSQATSRWVHHSCKATVFKIAKEPNKVSAILVIRREMADGKRSAPFAILLGSITEFTVGFDVHELGELGEGDVMQESYVDLQSNYQPKPPGSTIELYNHRVTVEITEWISHVNKVYAVNLNIEPTTRHGLIGGILDAVEEAIPQPIRVQPKMKKSKVWQRLGI